MWSTFVPGVRTGCAAGSGESAKVPYAHARSAGGCQEASTCWGATGQLCGSPPPAPPVSWLPDVVTRYYSTIVGSSRVCTLRSTSKFMKVDCLPYLSLVPAATLEEVHVCMLRCGEIWCTLQVGRSMHTRACPNWAAVMWQHVRILPEVCCLVACEGAQRRACCGRDPKTGKQLPDELLLPEIATFFFAGEDTTSHTGAFTLCVLTSCPCNRPPVGSKHAQLSTPHCHVVSPKSLK